MTLNSFLLNCFTDQLYECNTSHCEHNTNNNQTDIKIDFWELLILMQRILIILYKILKKMNVLKILKLLV
ncbi:MAG TPA: hypothetical protein VHX42_03085 [Candidatus Babeliales bacterium]|jgi:hypothetical protein|nr:hypothetical protein [Candidatus Babeliales bacterium]